MRLFFAFCLTWLSFATAVRAREFTVLVYNVENLAAADGRTLSDDYRPKMYSRPHLMTKMNNIAKICAMFEEGNGPDIILFQEVERDINSDQYTFDHQGMLRAYDGVRIEDMLGTRYNREISRMPVEALLLKTLADRGMKGYRVAAADDAMASGPRRGVAHINVIFSRFAIGSVQTYLLEDAPAILEVQVEVEGKPLYLFNNHWAFGVDNQLAERSRIKAAELVRERLDEIFSINPSADILIAGDLNCFHDQKIRYGWRRTAVNDVLKAGNDERKLRGNHSDLYNLWYELPEKQRGSGLVDGRWTTFMQMIVSRGLYDLSGVQYIDDSFEVAAFAGVNVNAEGKPYRWSFQGIGRGYSKNFPLVARFRTVRTNRTEQFIELKTKEGDAAKK
jgi:endonuclease/exonuclease/phosphatase family metal-dependent hydrolase